METQADLVWRARRDDVCAFLAHNGRYPSSTAPEPAERSLGSWVGIQRTAIRSGALARRKAASLRSLPGWTDGRSRQSWPEMAAAVEAFVSRSGRLPKTRSPDPHEVRLGQWLYRQRKAIWSRALSDARRERLQALPDWSGGTPRDLAWEQNLERFVAYTNQFGRRPAGSDPDPEVRRLAGWAADQRQAMARGAIPHRVVRVADLPQWFYPARTRPTDLAMVRSDSPGGIDPPGDRTDQVGRRRRDAFDRSGSAGRAEAHVRGGTVVRVLRENQDRDDLARDATVGFDMWARLLSGGLAVRGSLRRLPVTAVPVPDESLLSWLDRTAWLLRVPTSTLVKRMGFKAVVSSALSVGKHGSLADTVSMVSGLPLVDVARLCLGAYPARRLGVIDDLPVPHDPWQSNACPACLAADGAWRKAWRLPWCFACAEHACVLIDVCATCGSRLRSRPRTESSPWMCRSTRAGRWCRADVREMPPGPPVSEAAVALQRSMHGLLGEPDGALALRRWGVLVAVAHAADAADLVAGGPLRDGYRTAIERDVDWFYAGASPLARGGLITLAARLGWGSDRRQVWADVVTRPVRRRAGASGWRAIVNGDGLSDDNESDFLDAVAESGRAVDGEVAEVAMALRWLQQRRGCTDDGGRPVAKRAEPVTGARAEAIVRRWESRNVT